MLSLEMISIPYFSLSLFVWAFHPSANDESIHSYYLFLFLFYTQNILCSLFNRSIKIVLNFLFVFIGILWIEIKKRVRSFDNVWPRLLENFFSYIYSILNHFDNSSAELWEKERELWEKEWEEKKYMLAELSRIAEIKSLS